MNIISIYCISKRIGFALLFFVLLLGCNSGGPRIETEQFGKILDVIVPDELVFGETYYFSVTIEQPTTCHSFKEFTVEPSGVELYVGAITLFQDFGACEDSPSATLVEDFEFTVNRTDRYEFYFLAEVPESNPSQPVYIRVNRPVVMP